MKKLSLIFSFLFIVNIAFSQSIQFKNITINNGLLSSTIYCVFQDSKGFIWFSTPNGVNKYDGKTFESFTSDNGLSDNEVLKIKEDSKGRIWFLTFNGKLSYYLDGLLFNPSNNKILKKAICHSNFVNFIEDSNQTLWFSTNIGEIMSISNDSVRYYHKDAENNALNSINFFKDKFGNLWGINKIRFYSIKNSKFTRVYSKYYPVSFKTTFKDTLNDVFYFISDDGLISIKNNEQKLIKKIPPNIINKGISSFFLDQNKIWITVLGNGVKVLDRNNNSEETYLDEKYISSSIIDRDKNIWISTIDNGVFFLSNNQKNYTHYTTKNGLSSEAIYSIIKDNKDRIWLGLRSGQINIIDNNIIRKIDLQSNTLIYNPIKKIYFNNKNKTIWYQSESRIDQINTVELKYNNIKTKLNYEYSLKSFDFDNNGNLAIATGSGVFTLGSDTKNRNINIDELSPFNNGRTFCVAFDKNNNLWYDQLNGLHILKKNQQLLSFSKKIPALNDRISHISFSQNGLVFASTGSSGVCVFKDFKLIRVITTKDGLSSNNCIKTYAYKNQLWVITSKGVNKIENPLGKIKNTIYDTQNGLLTNEVNDILIDDQFIYFASNKGLTKINKAKEVIFSKELPLYFKKFKVGDKDYKITDTIISLPYWKNNLIISFTAINFEESDKNIYQYKIKNTDKWVETRNNILEFASLSPDNYNIQIRAKKLGGIWSNTINLEVEIDVPFYESSLFIILTIVFIAIFLVFSLNKYSSIQRKKETEKLLNKSKIIALEQQALQAMMNPHFIFNVMNSIQYFINKENKNTANQLLTGFARLIRKNLDIVNKGEISLEEEIEYLNLYLKLESIRFGDKLNYTIEIDEIIETEDTFIPSMLLQPFIENAIWHGIMPNDGKGNISIKITQAEQLLSIAIIDDGIGIENSLKIKNDEYISRGMTITKERINLMNQLSKNEMILYVSQQECGGTIVKIIIPLPND